MRVIQKYYGKLSEFTRKEENMLTSHSIDEAHAQHNFKKQMEKEIEEHLRNKGKPQS